MDLAFNGRLYGPLGFSPADGPGVYYSFYEWEQKLKERYLWTPNNGGNRLVKQYLMYRDNDRCHYCKKYLTYKEATVDHFFPPQMWYIEEKNICDSIVNLVIACYRCNFVKGKKAPWDFIFYPRDNLSTEVKVIKFCKRNLTNIRLTLNGTKTLSGDHKGIRMYRNMSDQQRTEARDARFKIRN